MPDPRRAVLGLDPRLPGEDLRNAYIAGLGGSPLQDLVSTLATAFSDLDGTDADLFRKRRLIFQKNPDLAIKEFARMEEARALVIDLVRERLRANNPHRDPVELDDEARMTFSMTFGNMHYAVRDWITGGFPSDVADVLRQAVDLARRIVIT